MRDRSSIRVPSCCAFFQAVAETLPPLGGVLRMDFLEPPRPRRVADPDVTTFERREIRNHVKTCNDELRRCLAIKAERFRARGAVEVRGRAVDIKFRLLVAEF
jgi:hypothetical protein